MLAASYVAIAVSNTFFDSSNYDQPIQKYFIIDLMDYFVPGLTLEKTFNIQNNFLETRDSPWPFTSPEKSEYYQIGSIDDRYRVEK